MKCCLAVLMAMPLFIAACKKDHDDNTAIAWPTEGDPGCIERIFINKNDHAINAADIATVDNLFERNGIDHSNFRYTGYIQGTFATANPPEKHYQQIVNFDQYAKGVRYFGTDGLVVFRDDTVHQKFIKPVEIPALDTVPVLTLPWIRAMFRYHLQTQYTFRNSYVDSCFNAEFVFFKKYGYNVSPDSTFKAWRVTVKNHPVIPVAFYRDDNGSLIYFNSGVVPYL